jgi:hypothetical protein
MMILPFWFNAQKISDEVKCSLVRRCITVKFTIQEAMTAPSGNLRWAYNTTISLTSALDGGRWPTPGPGRFTPEKETRYPLYRRLIGPKGQFGRAQKRLPLSGFDPRTLQAVAILYIDCAIPTHDVVYTGV